ncbi:conserved Plasmodium protein, unknown function [Plasmodium sp. DRC-Itaito]|nr:conserved Plasmodium protein, unknown function [Plasmodium sp. DRC-Itaito]
MAEQNSTSSSLLESGINSTVQTMAQLVSESTPLSTKIGEVPNSTFSVSTLVSSLFPDSQVTPTQSSFSNSTRGGDDLVLVSAIRKIKSFLRQFIQLGSDRLYNSGGVTTTESTIFSGATTNGVLEQAMSTMSDIMKGSNQSNYVNLLSGNSTLVTSNMTNSTSNLLEENGPRYETVLSVFIIMFCLLGLVWSMVWRKEGDHIRELFCGKKKTKTPKEIPLDSLNNKEETIYENDNEENSGSLYENLNMNEDSDYDNIPFGRRRRYHDENGNDEENISFVRNKKNENEEVEEEVTYLSE